MLQAEKRALETTLKRQMLAIREQELDYYMQNLKLMGFIAALLAGFSWAGLTQVAYPQDTPYTIRLAYALVTLTSMCQELVAVMSITLLTAMAPGFALRGDDGSLDIVVDGIVEEYRKIYFHFISGLIFFHFSYALWWWLLAVTAPLYNIVSNIVLFAALYFEIHYALGVLARFKLQEGESVTSGAFFDHSTFSELSHPAMMSASRGRLPGHASQIFRNLRRRPHGSMETPGGGAFAYSSEQMQLAESNATGYESLLKRS